MDGTDLLVKAKEQLQETTKITITGFPPRESGVKALELDIDAYLVKPVHPLELLKIIDAKICNSGQV
jgi:response regulator RpfG family c-di-GMP phosphodiesterase